jgi:nuclear pore complex protein Nup155
MLSFANYSGDADSKIVREVWARLLDQALTKGGVAEACSVVKRVGSKLDPADGACLPLDIICLHLEKAAVVMCIFCTFCTCILETTCESIPLWYSLSCSYLQDRLSSGEELVGDDDVARALLGACKGLPGPVLVVYDHLLSNGAIIPSLNLKLRLLRSVLAILREWGISVIAHRLGTTSAGASFFLDGTFSLNQTGDYFIQMYFYQLFERC